MPRVDPERQAMRQQGQATGIIQPVEPMPKCILVLGQIMLPALVALAQGMSWQAAGHVGRMDLQRDFPDIGFKAVRARNLPVEIANQRVKQFGQQAIGKRLQSVFLLGLGVRCAFPPVAVVTRAVIDDRIIIIFGCIVAALGFRQHVFRPDEARFNQQRAVRIQADEGTSAGHVRRIEGHRAFFQRLDGLLDFTEVRIDFPRELIGLSVFRLNGFLLAVQRGQTGRFFFREHSRRAVVSTKSRVRPYGKDKAVSTHFQPSVRTWSAPTFRN